jgi:hypothetical protein
LENQGVKSSLKRDPITIVSILIQILNGLEEGKRYNFHQIKERCSLHWKTVKKYITLLKYVKDLSPIVDVDDTGVHIIKQSVLESYTSFDTLLLHLFYRKAFTKDTAIRFLRKDRESKEFLLKNKLIQKSERNTFYLTEDGKQRAFILYGKYTNDNYVKNLKKLIFEKI